jgi:D-xylose transport system permease protein
MTVKASTAAAGPEPDAEASWKQVALERLKSGDLGSAPILLAVVLIALFFYNRNSLYLSAENLSNLAVQLAGTAAVAMGIVFVLLLGEIDLSVGSVSGVGGVVAAELQLPGSGHQYSGYIAIAGALAVTAFIGAVQGSFVALIGVPSFVVTLAGLLFFQGLILKIIPQGTVNIEDNTIFNVANYYFTDRAGWIIATIIAVGYALVTVGSVVARRRHGIASDNLIVVGVKVVVAVVASYFVVWEFNRASGVPFVALLIVVLTIFWTYIAKRTTFGRHVYAVGGNTEAARRAGISVARIKILVFAISGLMAGVGGVIFASRLLSASPSAGQGTLLLDAISAAVIGGTSLFGGRGEVKSALLGALVITMIANGISLVGYAAYIQLMVTALILLAAVTLDTVLRRRQIAAGL